MMAASTAEPPVGASTCTSGNHVWTGHIGTLTAKAAKKAKNSSVCGVAPSGSMCQVAISKLPPDLLYRNSSPTSISREPVSYTHLRAHETDSYLVCRLLLEKKKKQ